MPRAAPLVQSGTSPALAPTPAAKPLRRAFHPDEETRYRVRLVLRSELEGPETVKIGAVTYVKTVQRAAGSSPDAPGRSCPFDSPRIVSTVGTVVRTLDRRSAGTGRDRGGPSLRP